MAQGTQTRPAGRVGRLLVGALLLLWAGSAGAPWAVYAPAIGIALGLLAFYVLVHAWLRRRPGTINPWLGALLANGVGIVVFLAGLPGGPIFGQGEGALGVLLYAGASLLVAAWRADPGCEVMSLPAAMVGGHTELACLVFSPLDFVEARLR